MEFLWKCPLWVLPLASFLMNFASFSQGMVFEGRLKVGAFKFSVLYMSTIPSAMRGDLDPYFQVLSLPPS